MSHTLVSFDLPAELAAGLPADPKERAQVLELGLREWRICKALERFARGDASLAAAAELAGIPVREMIPMAYAHGLAPTATAAEAEALDSLESAADL